MRNIIVGLLLLTATLPGPAAWAAQCTYQAPAPAGVVRVTRPALCFPIAAQGQVKIVNVEMTLNGMTVAAAYSEAKKAVLYRPAQPLTPGEYEVQCRVAFDDASSFMQQWRFNVAPDAAAELPEPSAAQTALIDAVNALRREIGRPPFTVSLALCAAAQAHAGYARGHTAGNFHEEQIGQPGATGTLPQDRADSFGFVDPVREVGATDTFAFALDSGQVRRLFDAPYHRTPFLEPDAAALGAGSSGGRHEYLATVLEISRSASEATACSPFAGQSDVPAAWTDTESPDPLRGHGGHSAKVGYPIVFAHFRPDATRLASAERINVTDMTLTTASGEEVPAFGNTPANDADLTDAALLIPASPLTPGTTYHVSVQAATEDGTDISREWDFTTAGKPPGRGKPSAGVQAKVVRGSLLVRFPRTVTRLQCFFGSVLQPSSPPVHADAHGDWLARYPLPAGAKTYRLVVTRGRKTTVVRGRLSQE